MKREYNTPTVEKIAFRYRDQIVVASGGTDETNTTTSEWSGGLICGNDKIDKFVEGAWDWQVCNWNP